MAILDNLAWVTPFNLQSTFFYRSHQTNRQRCRSDGERSPGADQAVHEVRAGDLESIFVLAKIKQPDPLKANLDDRSFSCVLGSLLLSWWVLGLLEFLTRLTQFELIDPVLPQAAQLAIHFYCIRNTQLEMLLLEGPDQGHSTDEGN